MVCGSCRAIGGRAEGVAWAIPLFVAKELYCPAVYCHSKGILDRGYSNQAVKTLRKHFLEPTSTHVQNCK